MEADRQPFVTLTPKYEWQEAITSLIVLIIAQQGVYDTKKYHKYTYICSKCTISCHEGVGYYTFPLDHSVLVWSDICHRWVVMGTCGSTCGVHDNRRHHVFRLGSLIGLRSMARFGWRDVCHQDGKVWELSDRF